RRERQREPPTTDDEECGRGEGRSQDEWPPLTRDRQVAGHHPIRGGLIHDIMARSRLPTSSIGWSASRRRVARNEARWAWFSSTPSRANWPDWISPRIFFISAFVCSLTTRGPRV